MTPFPDEVVKRPFGEASRVLMLERYFSQHPSVSPSTAWKHLYRLLLWIDQTTALAHCYESDKSQPGRHWYGRSLAFHDWLCREFGCKPRELHREIDLMFKHALAVSEISNTEQLAKRTNKAARQREPYAGQDMPLPGSDPDLEDLVRDIVRSRLGVTPDAVTLGEIIGRIRHKLREENKRKNLVGEGFEDALAAIASRVLPGDCWQILTRQPLHALPGFREPPKNEKARTVDLALLHNDSGRRILASVKWSVRADREEQFGVDYDAYARNEVSGKSFDFVFITNEFDAARITSAAHRRHLARLMFKHVVHVETDALAVVHALGTSSSAKALREMLDGESRHVISLADWLTSLQQSG